MKLNKNEWQNNHMQGRSKLFPNRFQIRHLELDILTFGWKNELWHPPNQSTWQFVGIPIPKGWKVDSPKLFSSKLKTWNQERAEYDWYHCVETYHFLQEWMDCLCHICHLECTMYNSNSNTIWKSWERSFDQFMVVNKFCFLPSCHVCPSNGR